MNAEKLKRLQTQVRIGGKGTPRRKKKVTHQTAATDDKKLQSSLKKLSVSTIPGIEEVNIIKDDLTVIHFNNPKAQASLSANTFAVTGHGETKKVVEMLPEILPQLGQETVVQLRMFANSISSGSSQKQKQTTEVSDNFVDDVPLLVEDFDQIANQESHTNSNTEGKNKTKATIENQQKSEKPDLITEPKKDKQIEMKPQIGNQNQMENRTMESKEKQNKQNKKTSNFKSEKENPAQILERTPIQTSSSNKAQYKTNKKEAQFSTAKKNVPKEDAKKESPTIAVGESKDTSAKDLDQSNKNNLQNITNKGAVSGNQQKDKQHQRKGQSTQKSIVKELGPIKDVLNTNKDMTENSKSVEKASAKEVNSVVKEETQQNNRPETNKVISENQKKTPIKDLALPIPPITPPQPKMPDKSQLQQQPTPFELTPKKDTIPPENKNEPVLLNANQEVNPDPDKKDNEILGSEKNKSSLNTAQNVGVDTLCQNLPASQKIVATSQHHSSSIRLGGTQIENTMPNVTRDEQQQREKLASEKKNPSEEKPASDKKPSSEKEPASEQELVSEEKSALEVKPASDEKPSSEKEPASEQELVSEEKIPSEEKSASEQELASEQKPTSEDKISSEKKPVSDENPALPLQDPNNKLENVEVSSQKMSLEESTAQQKTITVIQTPEVKNKEQSVTSTQQKGQEGTKQHTNQKQGVLKEVNKQSGAQKQKQSSDPKESSSNTDSKKGTDMTKEKPVTAKSTPSNNNAIKSQSLPQQHIRQAVPTQVSTKPIEKPAVSSKTPAGSTKAPPSGKKPTIATSNNTKLGISSNDNKNKTNSPVNRPKTNVAPAPQKPGKPRSNVNANAPQKPKIAEKPVTPQSPNVKEKSPSEATEKQ